MLIIMPTIYKLIAGKEKYIYQWIVGKKFHFHIRKYKVAACLAILIILSGCATKAELADEDEFEQRDFLKPVNEPIFSFNLAADSYVIRPIAKTYGYSPDWAKTGVSNFLTNLNEPANAVNGVLQFNSDIVGTSLGRFFINTTIGVLGFRDVASNHGLKYQEQNFSKTLASYGVGEGDYMVLPLIGPSTYRGTAGTVVDWFIDPLGWYMTNTQGYIQTGAEAISEREDNMDAIDPLYHESLDPYSATRAAFLQHQAFKE